ncbi:hypothetical protein DL240_15400 [Lujinxingia litoralis]|uniref:Uncharacterized protein n=1 Tax=Lujinxingia litoralis TaxID=2211119 RepID=A0A328C230_9DELT|nr:hypothetical protein [Lujinxingia litoralis]RAL20702.1 hypothetical protein DL240_15400 [Lujinxingia litoralis]
MTAPSNLPPSPSLRLTLVLALAASLGLSAAHLFLTPPLAALQQGHLSVALGSWLFAPASLAGLAFLVFNIELGHARQGPFALRPHLPAIAALSAPLLIGLLSFVHDPARFRPVTWLQDSATLGLLWGLGLALSALFWQGAIQLRLPAALPALARILVIGLFSALPPAAFLLHSLSPPDLLSALLPELLLTTLLLALLHDLGLSLRLVAFNALMIGLGLGIINHAHLI